MKNSQIKTDMIKSKDIQVACLATGFYWITSDYYYHENLSKSIENQDDITTEYENAFYQFTKDFSVRRSLWVKKGEKLKGQKATDQLLKEIANDGFIKKVKVGKEKIIDEFLDKMEMKWTRSFSLMAKFSALIKPDKYVMYDSLVANKMRELTEYKRSNNRYEVYLESFNKLKAYVEETYKDEIEQSYNFFKSEYKEEFKDFNIDAFINRMIDKLLWYRGKHER